MREEYAAPSEKLTFNKYKGQTGEMTPKQEWFQMMGMTNSKQKE
jgi:hypothetical protein